MKANEMYLKKELYELIKTDESIFDFIQEGSLDGLWYWDLENPENEWMNPQFWKTLGYNPDEMPHKSSSWQNIINQDDLKTATENFVKHCEDPNHPYDQIVRYTHKNGSTVWIRCRGLAIRDSNGKPIRMLGAHQDITEIKKAESELILAKDKLNEELSNQILAILENGNIAWWKMELPSGEVKFDKLKAEMLGYPAENFKTYNDFINLLHPEDYHKAMKAMLDFIEDIVPRYEVEYRIKTIEGNYKWFRDVGGVKKSSEENDKITIFGIVEDITERKQLELLLQLKNDEITIQNEEYTVINEELSQSNNELIIAKQTVEESESRYRELLANLDTGVVVHAKDTSIIHSNQRASELLGLSIEQMQGKVAIDPYWKFINEDHSDLLLENYPVMQVLNSKNEIKNQILGVCRSNDIKWLVVNGFPRIKNNDISEIIISFIDITDQKNAELALIKAKEIAEENEANITAIIEGTQNSIWAFNHNYEILYINQKFKNEFYQTFGVILEKSSNLILSLPEFLRPFWKPRYDRVLQNEQFTIEDEVETENGTIYIQVTFNPIIKNGQVIGGSCFGSDITERKQAEKELIKAKQKAEESEERFNLAMNASHDGIFDWNLETNEIYYSPAWKKMLGYEEFELPNDFSVWEKTTDPKDVKKSWELQQQLITKQIDRFVMEFKMKHKDGYWVDILSQAQAVFDENGKAIRMVGTHTDITQRKLTESILKRNEENLRNISDSMQETMSVLTLDGTFLYANQKAIENMTGGDKSDIIGLNIKELISKKQAESLIESYHTVYNSGKPFQQEIEIELKNENKWFFNTLKPIDYGNPPQPAILSVSLDIMERRKAKENLRLSEEKYRTIVENITDALYIHDFNGNLIDCNEASTLMTGYKREELIGNSLSIIDSEENKRLMPERMELLMSKNSIIFEGSHIKKDGNKIAVEVSAKVVSREGKGIIHGFVRDITERKKAEEKLIYISKMQSIILKMASEFINLPYEIVDESINNSLKELGEFVNADRAYIFEYDWVKNVCNNTYEWCNEGISPEIHNLQNVPNEVIDYWAEAHKYGKEMNIENVMLLPNDGLRQTLERQGIKSVLALPMMKMNECIGFIGFDSVITTHKYSENEMTLLRIFSEMLVNIGNRQALEKSLIEAKEKAEESDRLKSAFLANMSHEIRTPMNGILGFAHLLKLPDLKGDEHLEYIEMIEKSGKRMLNIINDIVDISKIEAGLMKLNYMETNINEQIEYTYSFFKPEAEVKEIILNLKMSLPHSSATIITDKEKVYAIFTNLVKNALKFTISGSIELGYEIVVISNNQFLQFYVKDTGIGIAKDKHEEIFKRFIQADIADKNARQGAGLGLSITKAYVEMLGGKIWVESEVGIGSTFYFTLPYNLDSKIDNTDKLIEASAKSDNVKKLKVLLAEDDKASEILISKLIQKHVKEIIKVSNGIEAVTACKNNPDVDLILMDILMPKMNGHEATREIRKFNKDVIIIAQTAYGLSGDKEKALESGCNDYIAKPINNLELQLLLQKYFGK